MSLVFLYEAGLSATSEDISDRCRKYALEVSQNASEGGIGASTIIIDDPDGDYIIKGFRRLRIYEDEAVDDVDDLIYNGFIVARKVIRGPYRTGAGRQWVCQMVDMNAVADFRIMYGSDANRPAENDTTRLAWLLGTNEAEFITNDDLVDTSNPVAMSKADYRGQRLSDVIRDCAQQSGYNWFIYTVEGASLSLGLWYAKPDWAQYTSDIRLSNDLDDVIGDDLTYEFSLDADLDIDPDRVYSGALGQWDGGTVYEEDAGISAEFTRRDAIVPMENVKTAAKATARALRYLSDFDTEERRITCSVRLPPARVNWIREGMRLPFRATHYPGFQGDFAYQRVLTRTVKQDSEDNYLLSLTLTAEPHAVACSCDDPLALVQHSDVTYAIDPITFSSTPSTCLLISALLVRGTPPIEPNVPTGFANADWTPNDPSGGGSIAISYRVIEPGDGTEYGIEAGGDYAVAGVEFSGASTVLDSATNTSQTATSPMTTASVTPPAGARVLLVGAFIKDGPGPLGGNTLPAMAISSPATELDWTGTVPTADQSPTMVWGYRIIASASGSYTMSATGDSTGFADGPWGSVLVAFGCE